MFWMSYPSKFGFCNLVYFFTFVLKSNTGKVVPGRCDHPLLAVVAPHFVTVFAFGGFGNPVVNEQSGKADGTLV